MTIRFLSRFAIVATIALSAAAPASASVLFSLLRVDDTHAILTATGNLGTVVPAGGNTHILVLDDPFAVDPTGNRSALVSSTLIVGGKPVSFVYDAATANNLMGNGHASLYFGAGSPLTTGAGFVGALNLQLFGGATFAAIGSSGNVGWGAFSPVIVGEWKMVGAEAVPEPASLALMGLAVLALAGARRRRQR